MNEYMTYKNPGKILPKIVLRPYIGWHPYKANNRLFVFDYPSIILFISILIAAMGILGFAWMVVGIAAQNMNDVLLGDFFLFAGGAGCILTFKYKYYRHIVYDREKGVIRSRFKPKLFSKKWKHFEVPFEECEGSLYRISNPRFASLMFRLRIRHPSRGVTLFTNDFAQRDQALGFWSFMVQYMDKDAPLPDDPTLIPYANRTKGVVSTEGWKTPLFSPGFIDPLEVWQGRQHLRSPVKAKDLFTAFEPRQMPVNVSVVPPEEDRSGAAEPCGKITPLPKKVLRPIAKIGSLRMDENRYVYDRPMPDNRYYYFAGWVLLCGAIALFAVHTAAAVGSLAAAALYFAGFRWLRRSKGTILDRKNGVVIFHQGLRFSPTRLPFDQCQGRLVKTEHVEGFNTYRLHLYHPVHGSFVLDNDNFLALDHLLGFWSFIVQFMDKNAPLPDVKKTDMPDHVTEGVGSWTKWACTVSKPGFVDPFAQWLKTVEAKNGKPQSQPIRPELT